MSEPPPPPVPLSEVDPDWAAQSKTPAIIGTTVVFASLSTVFTAARLYVRGGIMKKFQLDDMFITMAAICGWAAVALGIKASQEGNGSHFLLLTTEQKSAAIFWTIVGFCPGVMAFCLPKLAVVHLLTRLMNPSRWHKMFLWALAIGTNLGLLATIVVLFQQCDPVRAQWDFSIKDATCMDKMVLVYVAVATAAFSAFTDLYLAVYPAIVLFRLQITFRKKLALSGALGIGSVATVVAIYKCTRLPSLASEDFSYDTSDLVIWTIVEGSTIITASCIPVLQPLADRLFGRRLFGSSYNHRYYENYGSRSAKAGQSDVELSFRPNKRKVKDPNGLSFLDQTRAGSEESILKNGGKVSASGVPLGQEGRSMSPANGGILRTDVVTVSYGGKEAQAEQGLPKPDRGYF